MKVRDCFNILLILSLNESFNGSYVTTNGNAGRTKSCSFSDTVSIDHSGVGFEAHEKCRVNKISNCRD